MNEPKAADSEHLSGALLRIKFIGICHLQTLETGLKFCLPRELAVTCGTDSCVGDDACHEAGDSAEESALSTIALAHLCSTSSTTSGPGSPDRPSDTQQHGKTEKEKKKESKEDRDAEETLMMTATMITPSVTTLTRASATVSQGSSSAETFR